jgi:hypothetical protein
MNKLKVPGFTAEASLHKTRRYYCTSAHLYKGNDLPGSADGLLRFQALGHPPGSCATRCAAICRRCASEPENCDYGYCFEECIDLHCCEEGCGPCKLFSVGGECLQFCIDDDCNQGMVPCACPPGQTCTFDGCCPVSQTCGGKREYCCTGREVCSNRRCCFPCGTDCCERGMLCIQSPTGKPESCCQPCGSGGCCGRGQVCIRDASGQLRCVAA